MKTYYKIALMILLLAGIGIVRIHAETGFEKDIKSAEALIEQDRYKAAVSKLLKLTESKSIGDKEKGRAALLLATAYRKSGQDDKAFEILKGIAGSKPDDFYLEMGEAQLLRKKYDEAISASNCYDEKTNQANLLFPRAMWLKARTRFEMEDYLDCMRSCKSVVNFAMKQLSEGDMTEADKENLKKLDELKKLAGDLYEKARNLYDIKTYGEDYAWYRLGRVAEFAGKYDEAVGCYGKIRGGVLKDAGTCYTGHCLARMGKTREAMKTYSAFCESDPCGLYREEALYGQAVLEYQSGTGEKSVKDSLFLISKLMENLKVIAESTRKLELAGINDALKKDVIDETPQMFLKSNDCGNLIRTIILPESITNRLTAPWYLPCLLTRAELFHGFLLGENGEADEAARTYRKAMNAGKMKIISSADTLPSLLAGLVDGFYLLPGGCKKKLPQKYVNELSLSCFYYVSEEKELAQEIFKKLSSDDQLKPGTYAGDAARLGQAYCLFSEKKNAQAEKLLGEIMLKTKYRKQDIYTRTAYLYACILAGRPSEKQKTYDLFEAIVEKGDDDIAAKALLSMAVTAVNAGDFKKADEAATRIQNHYSKTPYAEAAKTLEVALRDSDKKEFSGKTLLPPVETRTGKVIAYRRTMVIPSLTDIEPDTSQFGSGDFIVYRIKCVARDPCATVRGVVQYLSENEPQIPGVKGNEIIFLRSPLLYIKNLQYGFTERFPALQEVDNPQPESKEK